MLDSRATLYVQSPPVNLPASCTVAAVKVATSREVVTFQRAQPYVVLVRTDIPKSKPAPTGKPESSEKKTANLVFNPA